MKAKKLMIALASVAMMSSTALGVVNAPTDLAGVRLWLDGNDVDGDGISESAGETYTTTWRDRSGLSNHFTAATAPTRTLGAQGGKDVLTFNGSTQFFSGPAVLAAGDDNYTYFAVFKSNDPGGIHSVYEQAGGGGGARSAILQVGGAYGFNGESNDRHDLVPIAAGTTHVMAMTVDNALNPNNIKITDNGAFFQGTTGNPGALNIGTAGATVGRKQQVNGEFMNGNIAEIIVYDRVLTTTEQADVSAYLNSKWGVSGINSLAHRWSFNDGTANDSIGTAHGALNNGASVAGGRLSLDGINDFVKTSNLPETNVNKTLVAWVSLADLAQTAGGVLTLEQTGGGVFDSIVYGERTSNQWMAGSDGFNRSNGANNGGLLESVTEPGEVMLAISYGPAGRIDIYRNGVFYAGYNTGGPITYTGGASDVLLGLRHQGAGGDPFWAGFINEARLYGSNLSASEIATLFALGPNQLSAAGVPEPASLSLLALGLVGLAQRRRSRQ